MRTSAAPSGAFFLDNLVILAYAHVFVGARAKVGDRAPMRLT